MQTVEFGLQNIAVERMVMALGALKLPPEQGPTDRPGHLDRLTAPGQQKGCRGIGGRIAPSGSHDLGAELIERPVGGDLFPQPGLPGVTQAARRAIPLQQHRVKRVSHPPGECRTRQQVFNETPPLVGGRIGQKLPNCFHRRHGTGKIEVDSPHKVSVATALGSGADDRLGNDLVDVDGYLAPVGHRRRADGSSKQKAAARQRREPNQAPLAARDATHRP